MKDYKKHAIPLRCRIAAKLTVRSPSAIFCKCALGRHHRTRRCAGCSANTAEIIVESLRQGLEDGLKSPQQLGSVTESTAFEAEETEWAEKGPAAIKAAPEEATFTAEMKISPDVTKACMTLAEACKQVAEALGRAVLAASNCVAAITRGVDIAQLLKAAKVQAALNEAPPRVRHLAEHSKKHRTRKKNINRALREYQGGPT